MEILKELINGNLVKNRKSIAEAFYSSDVGAGGQTSHDSMDTMNGMAVPLHREPAGKTDAEMAADKSTVRIGLADAAYNAVKSARNSLLLLNKLGNLDDHYKSAIAEMEKRMIMDCDWLSKFMSEPDKLKKTGTDHAQSTRATQDRTVLDPGQQ